MKRIARAAIQAARDANQSQQMDAAAATNPIVQWPAFPRRLNMIGRREETGDGGYGGQVDRRGRDDVVGPGYAVFEHDDASKTFRPGDMTSSPPQGNDAKCGFACHTIAKARDYVFTEYAPR